MINKTDELSKVFVMEKVPPGRKNVSWLESFESWLTYAKIQQLSHFIFLVFISAKITINYSGPGLNSSIYVTSETEVVLFCSNFNFSYKKMIFTGWEGASGSRIMEVVLSYR